jgi:hypothetical protein
MIRAEMGAMSIITRPEGAITSPTMNIDWPSPYPLPSGIWRI